MLRLVIFIFLCTLSSTALSSTIYVDQSNINGPWLGTKDYPFIDIQDGIDAASGGDTVLVMPGIYNKVIVNLNINLVSSNGCSLTTINALGNGSVITITGGLGSGMVIDGFTLTGGSNSYGAGILCWGDSSPMIKNNIINENKATAIGGGICCFDSSPIIKNNTITYNTVIGKTACGGGIYCQNSSAKILNNIINHNEATIYGGGIYCVNSDVMIDLNTITENISDWGGGISCHKCSSLINNNSILKNIADYAGGGICIYSDSSPTITNNTISENTASDSISGYYGGGGISCLGANPIIDNNNIFKNFSKDSGGGINCSGSGAPQILNNIIQGNIAEPNGGGISVGNNANPTIKKNTITKNLSKVNGGGICCINASSLIEENYIKENSSKEEGGGIHVQGKAECNITKNLLIKNISQHGGGISCKSISAQIMNNIIKNNIASHSGGGVAITNNSTSSVSLNDLNQNYAYQFGGGIACYDSQPSIKNNLIRNNAVPNYFPHSGGGIYFINSGGLSSNNTIYSNSASLGAGISLNFSSLKIINNIVWANSPDGVMEDKGASNVSYCDIQDAWLGAGKANIIQDPLFVNPMSGDFHLQIGSPCINRGTENFAPTIDMDGDLRPFMGTVDMGADEYTGIHHLRSDNFSIDKYSGGSVTLSLYGGKGNGGRPYIMCASTSGTAPGIPVGKAILPLVYDPFFQMVFMNLNTPSFSNFASKLNQFGFATATFDTLGPQPSIPDLTISFAFMLINPKDFTSNPVNIIMGQAVD